MGSSSWPLSGGFRRTSLCLRSRTHSCVPRGKAYTNPARGRELVHILPTHRSVRVDVSFIKCRRGPTFIAHKFSSPMFLLQRMFARLQAIDRFRHARSCPPWTPNFSAASSLSSTCPSPSYSLAPPISYKRPQANASTSRIFTACTTKRELWFRHIVDWTTPCNKDGGPCVNFWKSRFRRT